VYEEISSKRKIDFSYMEKMRAMPLANGLARRMLILNDEEIEDILYMPFAYDDFDKEDISNRIKMLTPSNSFVIF
jgi:secreted Zn-dependent insulinase-like peptidase